MIQITTRRFCCRHPGNVPHTTPGSAHDNGTCERWFARHDAINVMCDDFAFRCAGCGLYTAIIRLGDDPEFFMGPGRERPFDLHVLLDGTIKPLGMRGFVPGWEWGERRVADSLAPPHP